MTNKQKQNLLQYLGYYDGKIDGIWGIKSIEATERLQEDNGIEKDGLFGPNTEEIAMSAVFYSKFAKTENTTTKVETTVKVESTDTQATGTWWDDVKYFDRHEFACKCGKCGGYPVEPKEKLIKVADRVREYFDSPITVSSGVRCKTHNANVGGVSNSRHLSGKAMDFAVQGKTANQVLSFVNEQSEIRYAYAIDSKWLHMDID